MKEKQKKRWEKLDRAWKKFIQTKKVSDWIQVQIEASKLDLDAQKEFYER